ncbi:Alpha N-terminal protein methyltransferase 1 [Acarospora aff. strigata]|nr:Alpha N-terminal protein methyltransferase 1 [Acarospora aff. strigata]
MGDANCPPDAQIDHSAALSYWNSVPPNVDGMLGGYPQISRIDLQGSANFLAKLRRQYPEISQNLRRGVDCGAGIGRVTAGFLSKVCDVVDVVEPVEKFAREASKAKMLGKGKVGDVYTTGLEDWIPAAATYDMIWNQWCLGHLTDRQMIDYLKRSKEALTSNGWIVIKENLSTDRGGADIFDEVDSSVTRTDSKFQQLYRQAGVKIVKTELQPGFPKGLYPVRFYALRPDIHS